MNWFRRLFQKEEHEHYTATIPFSTITRWALYDIGVDSPNEIAILMGLNPVSDEGNDKEIEDSMARLEEVEPLLPFIDVIAELTAVIIASEQATTTEDVVDEEDIEHLILLYKAIGASALINAFSAGLQLDIFHAHTLRLSTIDKEENDE